MAPNISEALQAAFRFGQEPFLIIQKKLCEGFPEYLPDIPLLLMTSGLYDNLDIQEDHLTVHLTFSRRRCPVKIPYLAILVAGANWEVWKNEQLARSKEKELEEKKERIKKSGFRVVKEDDNEVM